jgi:hypothetical protein
MRNYSFQVELDALRLTINKEHYFTYAKYVKPKHADLLPLLVCMDTALRQLGYLKNDHRSMIRKDILGFILGKKVTTSYDLTLYQCSAIFDWFKQLDDKTNGEGTRLFLKDCQSRVEAEDLSRAIRLPTV